METIITYVKKNKKYFLSATIIFIIILSVIFLKPNNKNESLAIEMPQTEEKTLVEVIETFFVDIKGEVKKPGIYEVNSNTMVYDLINLAGGLTKNGTTENINLSQNLKKSMVVVINSKKELKAISNTIVTDISDCTCDEVVITNCVEEEKLVNNKISINTGTKEQLMTLNGIGESKAQDIILYRDTNGLFNNIEDIMNVNGIGEALFAKIKENITT